MSGNEVVRRIWPWILSPKWLFLPPVLLGVGVVAALASAKKELPRVSQKQAVVPVNVILATRTPAFPEVVGFGTAKALRTWSATAEVGGRIEQTHARLRSGIAVQKGELLLQIDQEDYQMRVEQRRAELVQAQSQLAQLRLAQVADQASLKIQQQLLEVRRKEVERMDTLTRSLATSESERDANQATLLLQAQTVQNLESSLATYPAQIASSEASVTISKSRVREAERDVERTAIRAPFHGVLSDVSLEPAQYVAANQRLFQVVDMTSVEIEAQFSVAQLSRVLKRYVTPAEPSAGDLSQQQVLVANKRRKSTLIDAPQGDDAWIQNLSATVAVRSGDVELNYPAHVLRMSDAVDEQTRTIGIVLRVENQPDANLSFVLRPGTYCEVILRPTTPTAAFVVPQTCMKANSVFVVDEAGHLRRREVRVAFPLRDRFAVDSGIESGEMLVLTPPARAREGEFVAPRIVGQVGQADDGATSWITKPEALSGSESSPE